MTPQIILLSTFFIVLGVLQGMPPFYLAVLSALYIGILIGYWVGRIEKSRA